MTDAVRLYRHTFDGADTPGVVDAWPGFEIPLEQDEDLELVNPQSGLQSGLNAPVEPYVNEPGIPTLHGDGRGMGPRGYGAAPWRWVLRSENRPGRQDYRAALWAQWRAPGSTTYPQGVGVVARFRDLGNYAVARLVANADGTPTLRIWTVEDGVATARGDAYSGAHVTADDLYDGLRWSLVCVDNEDGTTTLRAYTRSSGAASRGTLRASWTGAVPSLRGPWGTGVELTGGVVLEDVLVDDHEVYDLSDESDVDLGDGSGWVLEVDGVRYAAEDLGAHDPKVHDVEVTQSLGASGCTATITADGEWVLKAGLRPGRKVVVYHHGAVRFRGTIVSGSAAAKPQGSQSWVAMDAMAAGALVDVAEDDGTGTLYFNLADEANDYYDADRQDMTIGDVLAFMGDRYRARLAAVGASPADGSDVFDVDELAALDAVVPGLAVSGNFTAVVLQLVAKMRRWQPFVDPETVVWRMRDITGAQAETLECTAEWVKPSVSVDVRRSVTAIEFVGVRGERGETALQMGVAGATDNLSPQWTAEQEAGVDGSKQAKQSIAGKIAGAGTETFRGVVRTYITVAASYGLTTDQFRGGICNGEFVVGNTTTKIYMYPSAWPGGIPPSPGTPFVVTLLDERAQWWLASIGVGRSFRAKGIPTICNGAPSALAQGGFDRAKACGLMRVGWTDPSTRVTSYEEIDFGLHMPSDEAIAAGFCDPTVVLAKKPARPVSFMTTWIGPEPGGSPPPDQCSNPALALSEVSLEAKLRTLGEVPRVRVPAAEDTYEGRAWTEYGWARLQRIELSDFTSMDQAAGLTLAGQALLDVLGDVPLLFTAEIASPWHEHAAFPRHAHGYPTAQWAGLTKRVVLTSKRRTTGLESGRNLVVYSVTWSLLRNTTTIQAGTAAGWLNLAAEEIARTYLERPTRAAAAQSLQTLRDVVACLNGGTETTVGAQPSGPIPGCKVEVVDRVRRTTIDVDTDDQHKKDGLQHLNLAGRLGDEAGGLGGNPYPGLPIPLPGYDGDDGRTFVAGYGSIPRAPVETWLPGPTDVARGRANPYGGPYVSDKVLAGRPPDIVARFPWGTVRKAADASGDHAGGQALEWSPNDAQGAPTGSWAPLTTLLDVGPAGLPLRHAAAGSYPAQLAARDAAVAARLGIRLDAAGRVLAPGAVADGYPDGVPADHVTTLRAAAVASGLRPRWETLSDPGGLVLHGPVGADGVDAGLDWRVLPPGHGLVLVEAVTPGSGRNGGAWDDVVEEDGTYTLIRGGGVVHKQIDAPALRADRGDAVTADAAPAASEDPHCFTGAAGRVLAAGAGVVTGAGGILSMPPWAVGDIAVTAHLREVLVETPEASGRAPSVRLSYARQGSAWTAPTTTAAQEPEVTDGSGTGTALAVFLVPGGAVPPGLRKPFDLSLSVQRDGDAGDMTGDAVVTGIGVDVAVAERASLHRAAGGLGIGGEARDNHGIALGALAVGGGVVESVVESVSGALAVDGCARVDTVPWSVAYGALAIAGTVADAIDPLEVSGSLGIGGRSHGRLT